MLVAVPIVGLAPDRAAGLRESVLALTHPLFQCPACKQRSREAGQCERCEGELVEAKHSMPVAEAKLTIDRRFLSVTLRPHHWGSLNEFGRLAVEAGGKLRRELFQIPEFARIQVRSEEGIRPTKLRSALLDLEVFPAVSIEADPDGKTVWVLPRELSEPVTLGKFGEALAKMRTKYEVLDVQWAAFCTTCNSASTVDTGSPTCRSQ